MKIPIFIILLGITLLTIGSYMRLKNKYLPPGSPSTTATILDEFVEVNYIKGSNKSTSFQISYTYSVNGINYNKSERIGMEPQKEMTAFYNKDNPDFSIIDFHRNSTHTCFDLIFGGIFFCMWGAFWLYKVKAKKNVTKPPLRRPKPKNN